MVDMFYANVQADSKGLGVTIHYNNLLNADRESGQRSKISEVSDALYVISDVCNPTNRPIEEIGDIFMPPANISSNLDPLTGQITSDQVVRAAVFPRESGFTMMN